MRPILRLETPDDYRTVEELTRDAFWMNTDSRPFIDEHLLVHKLRSVPAFVPALDYVAEIDGKIVGNVMYSKAQIVAVDGQEYEVLNFGPLSVLPSFQSQGIGKALMNLTIAEARRLGYRAIVFFGHPDYYPRFGFRRGAEFGITHLSGKTYDALMAMELYDGALNGISGKFVEDETYLNLSEDETAAFDRNFPPKQPLDKVKIDVLLERLEPTARETVKSLGLTYLCDIRGMSERMLSELSGIDARAKETIRTVMQEHGRIWGEGDHKNADC